VFDATMRKLDLNPVRQGDSWQFELRNLPNGIYWLVSPESPGLKIVLQR
jgi:hypothetical protein